MEKYEPRPTDVSAQELPAELLPLMESLARNVHEVWARGRMDQGWTYGTQRDDHRRTHPCLVPYERLSEEEKDYDRATAAATLKFILAKGFKITQ